jgi:hypothetical protein
MGIVVLRSTTPCVAVSSRNNSNLLTVISMVVVPVAADAKVSTGIMLFLPGPATLNTSLYQNQNLINQ